MASSLTTSASFTVLRTQMSWIPCTHAGQKFPLSVCRMNSPAAHLWTPRSLEARLGPARWGLSRDDPYGCEPPNAVRISAARDHRADASPIGRHGVRTAQTVAGLGETARDHRFAQTRIQLQRARIMRPRAGGRAGACRRPSSPLRFLVCCRGPATINLRSNAVLGRRRRFEAVQGR